MSITGGIPNKLGNRYEAKWLVRQLLDVIAAKADWLRFEGITSEFAGFEFAVRRGNIIEWHQTKNNAPSGNWTINALKHENVLAAFKTRLESSSNDRCVFVSQDPAKDLQRLAAKAKIANDLAEFTQAVSSSEKDKFEQLMEAWEVENVGAYDGLKRCDFQTLPEAELNGIIASYGDLYFLAAGSSLYPILRDYAEGRFNTVLTTELIRKEIREAGTLILKDWSLEPTLRERLRSETDEYLRTYSPFGAGGSTIPRRQTSELSAAIEGCEYPSVVLITGIAGSGKSGIIRAFIHRLRELGVVHLALRVDHHLNHGSPQEIGHAITGRQESPVATLKGLEPERLSMLIVDQVDAVSEVAGRNGAVKEAVLRMVDNARHFKTVCLVLVCRSFDFDNDPRLKALRQDSSVVEIEVPLLTWDNEVSPFLAEKGIDTTLLSPTQKDLLQLPLNLGIFFEVASEGKPFASRNDLFQTLIERKDRLVRKNRSISWGVLEPLTALTSWMSDRQQLNAPEAVLDRFPDARDILASEGLIVRSCNGVNFFHESFFDYVYARSFVFGGQTLIDLLTSTEQHLFRRTQVRQILETLRQNDRTRYYHEVESVLKSGRVRYHIKAAVAQWLGSLSDPSETEKNIILRLDDNAKAFRPIVRYALFTSTGWFNRLHQDGWVHGVLTGESEERRQSVLLWLSNIAGQRPSEIAGLMEKWWGNDSERGKQLLNWFGFVKRQTPDHSLVALCERVIRSRPPGLFETGGPNRREMVLATWAEKNPDGGWPILKALFDTWFDAHPDRHPFERDELRELDMYSLRQISEKSPKAFIEGTIDALLRSIEEVNRREETGERDYSFHYRTFSGETFGADEFLGLFRSALRRITREDPGAALGVLSKLDVSKHEAFLHLHFEMVSANGAGLYRHFLGLLGCKGLFKAGWDGAGWKSFADAARAAFPYLCNEERRKVEDIILAHRPEIDRAVKLAHELTEQGETDPWYNRRSVIWDLNQSGFKQWCVLETIGETLLSDAGIQQLKILRRKFVDEQVPEPHHLGVHDVGSPIQRDRTEFMNDEQWLRAIGRYADENERRRGKGFTDGGARQLAGELQRVTKENPERFAALMTRIPDTAHPTYLSHIVWGVVQAKDCAEGILKEAIFDAHRRPGQPYGTEISRIFEKCPQLGKDAALFDVLSWYIENGEANDDETVDSANTEREIISIQDLLDHGSKLHIRGVSGARGYAAEALAAVLWHVPEVNEKAWEILDRRIDRERLITVRCCLLRPLVPLYNSDRLRCAQFVERLVGGALEGVGDRGQERPYRHLSPLVTHHGVNLLPYLLRWVPEIGRQLLGRLLESGDETMRMIGAWHVINQSFQDPGYATEADQLVEEGEVYRRLAAGVAADVIAREEFRERAERQLIRFFNDDDEKVRKQASGVFRRLEPSEFSRFYDLANKYVDSRALEDDAFAFFHALEEATSSVHAFVIRAAERIIADFDTHAATAGRRSVDLHQLQGLLKREYAASESNPQLRRRLLDVIDMMLERELYGTLEIVKAHERE